MPYLLSIATIVLSASLAVAGNTYRAQVGIWTVTSATDSCSATNRPLSESLVQPINQVFLTANKKTELNLAVAFWPKAISQQDNEFKLQVIGHKPDYVLSAKSTPEPWNVMRSSQALPPELIQVLDGSVPVSLENLVVTALPSNARTIFNIQDLPRLIAELKACVVTLG